MFLNAACCKARQVLSNGFLLPFSALLFTVAVPSLAQPPTNFDLPNTGNHDTSAPRALRPDNNTDTKTTDTKAAPEDKPHILPPFTFGPNNEYKLQFGGDVRFRFEDHHNYDLRRQTGDNDKLGLLRSRINWDLTYCSFVRAFVEVMDSREIDAAISQNAEDYFDLHQLFLELKDPAGGPWSIRAGRQILDLGKDNRLVQSSNWSNLPRTHDGLRLMYRSQDLDNDTILLHPDYYEHANGVDVVTGHERPRRDEWFYGSYFTLKQFKPHTIEAYFLGLSDTNNHRTFPRPVKSEENKFGTTDRYTIGSALYGPLWKRDGVGTLSYGTDAAYQFGHRSNDEIHAYMLHGDLDYQWEKQWKPKVSLVGNIASGDRQKGDGESNTFNPLFGSTHGPYGIIDFVRLQNLRELALVGSVEPTEKWKAQLELHRFWLDSPTDAWYDARGNTVARDATGHSGSGLGDEIDAILTYKMNKFVTLEGGAAHWFGNGDFADGTHRGDAANFLYLQTSISF